ncbi:hypothetical protein, partial [Streptomyces sp. NPDC054940]
EDVVGQFDPQNPEQLQDALQQGMFQPEDTPEDQEDAALTADALWAAGDGRTRLPGAGGVPTPREHVRLAYGAWLAAHPQLDPLAPGSWL